MLGFLHVSEAFKRAGLSNGSTKGWLLHIPDQRDSMDSESLDMNARQLLSGLGLETTSETLDINIDGVKKLGISIDEAIDSNRIEASLIGHILLADVSSSQ